MRAQVPQSDNDSLSVLVMNYYLDTLQSSFSH